MRGAPPRLRWWVISKVAQVSYLAGVANADFPASRRPFVWVAEALGEDIRCHCARWLIFEREILACVALVEKRHTYAMCAAQTPHRLVLTALDHADGYFIILVHG